MSLNKSDGRNRTRIARIVAVTLLNKYFDWKSAHE